MQWRDLETFSFGDNPVLAAELAALVLDGRKTATCWFIGLERIPVELMRPLLRHGRDKPGHDEELL